MSSAPLQTGTAAALRLTALLLLLLTSFATSQEARLSIGFDGEVVAGRWNPIEFSFRDHSNVTLTLTIDQGDLRSGPLPARHTFTLQGGPGLSVLEEDLFVPAWQSFTWSASTSQRVIASGTFHPRDLDARSLAVILSTNAGRHSGLVPAGTRAVSLPSARLPERLAAWDGVALLIIDGTTAPPSLESLIAAAAAGADVQLLSPLPASFSDLLLLTSGPVTHLGAGRLLVTEAAGLPVREQPLPAASEIEAFMASANNLDLDRPLRLVILVPFLAAYCLLTIILLRTAGLPGAAAAAVLGVLAVLLALPVLQAEPRLTNSELQLRISAGGLSRSLSVYQLLDRTGGSLVLPGSYRPVDNRPFETDGDSSSFTVQRWRPLQLARRPILASAGSAANAGTDSQWLTLFPSGSTAVESDNLVEIFLPEPEL